MVERMVVRRAGLTGSEAAALLTAGRRYLEAIGRIDADARAEVDRRWGAASAIAKLDAYNHARFGIPQNATGYPSARERRRLLARFTR